MLQRCIIGGLLLILAAPASAIEPVLLLLLRMARDQAIATSIERGVGAIKQEAPAPAPLFGYALPTEPVAKGTEEQRLRVLIDEGFLHLTAQQRNEVFAGLKKILNDPQYSQNKPLIVAEFTLHANAARDSYRMLDRLNTSEKRRLAVLARDEFRRLPSDERRQMIDALKSGMLPMPRDLSAIMLAELSAFAPVLADQGRVE